MPLLKKIDQYGKYLEFQGVSVIADVDNKDKTFWLQVYEFLNHAKSLLHYYAPLPYQSYHMTTNHLYTQSDYPDNWPLLLSQESNWFQRLHAKLTAMPFIPTATVVDINVSSRALQLNLSISQSQYALIKAIADEFGIQNKIPPQFHVTLAYAYHQQVDAPIIAGEIEKLASLCLKKDLIFTPPRMCFFHNMQQFFSWNGTHNPFTLRP